MLLASMMSVSAETTSLWQRALQNARLRSPASFDQWFSSVQFDGLQDGVLGLTARDEFVRDWVKTHFLPAMLGDLERLMGVDSNHALKVDWRISSQLSDPIGSPPSRPRAEEATRHEPWPAGEDVARSGSPGLAAFGSLGADLERGPASYGARAGSSVVKGRSSLRGSDLRGSDLRGSDLRGSDLRGSDLRNSDLRGSDLRGSDARSSDGPVSSAPVAAGPISTRGSSGGYRGNTSLRLTSTAMQGDPLNPKHTFPNFVVGPSNELAYAAAIASAGGGGPRYNPLFICGGTGLGKTHLMHSIAHHLLDERPGACVLYLSAERFTNEFIESLQHHRMEEFRARYRRGCDALLVDDIQFLAGREQTQEEFFHTFNALRDADKPIVVTSDKYPQELQRMPERLISRFTSGLVADVQTPALETRVAILRKKAALEGIPMDHDVAVLLAQHVKSNVRELEGTLIRLAAKSSLLGRSIDLAFAQSELALVNPLKVEISSVEDIQRAVCNHFSLSNSELISKDRHKSVAFARQVAMYLCRQRLKCSFPELGRAFGNRDHTTVMSACRRVESLRKQDPQVNAHLQAIEQKLASDA